MRYLHQWSQQSHDLSNSLHYKGSCHLACESCLESWVLLLDCSRHRKTLFSWWIGPVLIVVECPWPPSWVPCDLFHPLPEIKGSQHRAHKVYSRNSTCQLLHNMGCPRQSQVLYRILTKYRCRFFHSQSIHFQNQLS